MGIGDQLIASGIAREVFAKRSRKVAFGSDGKIIWDKHSEEIFRNNPKICFPGHEVGRKLEWVKFHKGHRGYNAQGSGHWIWNYEWRCYPGEFFFARDEIIEGTRFGSGFTVIEPNIVRWKSSARNKDWGASNYQELADRLSSAGANLLQFLPPDGGTVLKGVKVIRTRTFRAAAAILKNAKVYVGAEGGMHHAAAALDVRGVVLFGGFIPPSVTGYDIHTNLVGSDHFCGSFSNCDHCTQAMNSISVDKVFNSTMEHVRG